MLTKFAVEPTSKTNLEDTRQKAFVSIKVKDEVDRVQTITA